MIRTFFGVKEDDGKYWIVVNAEGAILSINGLPFINGKDKFGCSSYIQYIEQSEAIRVANEYERTFLLFNKPRMKTKELFFHALSHIDWVLVAVGVSLIIKAIYV